eukprot:2710530-Pleurochrysis_carterae.AAC.2
MSTRARRTRECSKKQYGSSRQGPASERVKLRSSGDVCEPGGRLERAILENLERVRVEIPPADEQLRSALHRGLHMEAA